MTLFKPAAAFCWGSVVWLTMFLLPSLSSVTALLRRHWSFHSCWSLWAGNRAKGPGAAGVWATGQWERGSQGTDGGGAETRGGAETARGDCQAAARTGHLVYLERRVYMIAEWKHSHWYGSHVACGLIKLHVCVCSYSFIECSLSDLLFLYLLCRFTRLSPSDTTDL